MSVGVEIDAHPQISFRSTPLHQASLCSSLARKKSKRGVAVLCVVDAGKVLNRLDDYPSVTRFSGASGSHDRGDNFVPLLIGDGHFDPHAGLEIDGIFTAPVYLGMPLMMPKTTGLSHDHTFQTDAGQGMFDFLKLEGTDNGND